MNSFRLPLLYTLFVAITSHAQSTLFKCVDEKGITHYGETMPAACAKKEITEMSKQGRTVRKVDAPLTPEQQKARDIAAAKQRDDDKRVADQRQKDLALLGTYGAEREIDIVRDKDVAQLDQRRKFLEGRIGDVDARIERVNNLMEFYVAGKSKTAKETAKAKDTKEQKDTKDAKDGKSGKDGKAANNPREVPPQLQADFDRAQTDRNNLRIEMERLEIDKTEITARYENEKDRFRRLKNGMRPGTVLDEKGNVLIEAPIQRGSGPPRR